MLYLTIYKDRSRCSTDFNSLLFPHPQVSLFALFEPNLLAGIKSQRFLVFAVPILINTVLSVHHFLPGPSPSSCFTKPPSFWKAKYHNRELSFFTQFVVFRCAIPLRITNVCNCRWNLYFF